MNDQTKSKADLLRAMTDEELRDFIFDVSARLTDICVLWCKGDQGCVIDGDVICEDANLKACILAWLRSPGDLKKEVEEAVLHG